jgi:hypothetical protein
MSEELGTLGSLIFDCAVDCDCELCNCVAHNQSDDGIGDDYRDNADQG